MGYLLLQISIQIKTHILYSMRNLAEEQSLAIFDENKLKKNCLFREIKPISKMKHKGEVFEVLDKWVKILILHT